jgi:quercetin dioxygenase-like cupin family protein
LAGARVVRPAGAPRPEECSHEPELLFLFVLQGALRLDCERQRTERLMAGDSLVIPPGFRHSLGEASADLELLEVSLPREVATPRKRQRTG